MSYEIKKAARTAAYLRVALCGVSGAGKTFSALKIASGMGKKIVVLDSELGSSNLYEDVIPGGFHVLELKTHHPRDYIEAIEAAVKFGADVVIIDSLSHAWMGKEGALELVDASAGSGNKFTAWRNVTPLHNQLVDAILTAKCHIIATMRSKSEWVLEENQKGKKEPRKIGLAPIQRDGIEYEFTAVGDISLDHILTWSKTRISELDGRPVREPGEKLGAQLLAWVRGVKPPAEAPQVQAQPPQKPAQAAPQNTPDCAAADKVVDSLARLLKWEPGLIWSDLHNVGVDRGAWTDNQLNLMRQAYGLVKTGKTPELGWDGARAYLEENWGASAK